VNWSRRHTLVTGLALIVVVNAVALAGVAYNRSGDADSILLLTERELQTPYMWRGNKENSGLSLELQWRVLPIESKDADKYSWRHQGYGVSPAWLNGAKMAELGFDRRTDSQTVAEGGAFAHQLPRDVLLVLEFDGDAYQAALSRAQKYIETGKDSKDAQEVLEGEKTQRTRLFVVDAGLDHSVLRAKYANRDRFAIVRGEVRPALEARFGGSAPAESGFISDVSAKSLNVQLKKRGVFDAIRSAPESTDKVQGQYVVIVAFGRRLEPWIMHVAVR